VVQTVIAGGPDAEETVKGTMALMAATDVPVILWLNEHLGPLELQGRPIAEASFLHEARDRILGTILLPARTKATFGKDTEEMLRQRLTFTEAIARFDLMPRIRIKRIRDELWAQLDALPLGPSQRVGVSEQDDLIGDLIAEVARSHGVAISRDDPVVAVVLLNQIVLRRYLEETVAPAADAIREATNEAVRQVEQFAEAQATWLEQVSVKDRASFLEEQKALHDAWKADMETLIEGQNTGLRQVVMQAAAVLRAQGAGVEARSTAADAPENSTAPTPPGHVIPWGWLSAGTLMGSAATAAVTVIAWLQLAAQ
jgi:hypothetical protein